MKRFALLILVISLSLSGCGWFSGSYLSVTPHSYTAADRDNEVVTASNYDQLCDALVNMVHSGIEERVINVADYDRATVELGMERALRFVRQSDPIGAYAVEQIEYELGTSGALPAIAVEIVYRRDWTELQKIQIVQDMEDVQAQIGAALERYDSGIVLLVNAYTQMDLQQITEDYAAEHPDTVMEVPTVTEETYPESGTIRVLEIRFSYQNSRDGLRQMQEQVAPVFTSAALYVSGDDADARKYSQLYAFLKERFGEYQIKTSITPVYSLLRHGVGDSKAFAVVYAQMCRKADLECRTVTGTRDGEAWWWNMVCVEGNYYHVDLLHTENSGRFQLLTDEQMESYVWDYSAYPACVGEEPARETEQTEPETTEPIPPETPVPVPPETTQPQPPETTVPVPAETTEPIPPETTEPLPPETTETIPPETSEPTQPETTEPASTENEK